MIWTFDYPLQTERLDLRPHTLADLNDLEVFHGDPAITRYIPWPTRTREQTQEALTAKLAQTAAGAAGDWIVLAIEERQSRVVIGEILLKRESDNQAEIGYVLAASAQGRGYAREAITGLLRSAVEMFEVTTIDAVVDQRNEASIRLLGRCGFDAAPSHQEGLLRFRRRAEHDDAVGDIVYTLDGQSLTVDGLDFEMIDSTASRVDRKAPTRFRYRQQGALVWGDYTGDTVTSGRFVGRAVENRIEISFAHQLHPDGAVVTGSAVSVAERRADGLLYLVENFEKDGRTHRSVCKQIVRRG